MVRSTDLKEEHDLWLEHLEWKGMQLHKKEDLGGYGMLSRSS